MQEPDNHPDIESLLRQAGRRPRPADEAVARIRNQVHAEWTAGVRRRRHHRWMAMAAALGLLAIAGWLSLGLHRTPPIVAQVESGDRGITQGERLDAGPGRGLVLRIGTGGVSVRLAAGSSIRFEAPERIRLLGGSLYVDAVGEVGAARLEVLADRAVIEHIGTQFLVGRADGRIDVAVRSGSVLLRSPTESATLRRGELGRVNGTGAHIETQEISTSGEPWAWVDALAPPLAIEGLSLHEALTRLTREAGLQLEFDSPRTEMSARDSILHGPALELLPDRAIQAVLATTGLAGQVQPGESRLIIHMH